MKKILSDNLMSKGEIVIYKANDGLPNLEIRLEKENVWLTQAQIASLFDTERSVITKHLGNIFKEDELARNSVCAFFAHTATDGKVYRTAFYSLDAIISVGYRVNSRRATQFRIWATNVLKKHIIEGYTINEKRLKESRNLKLDELEKTVNFLRRVIDRQPIREIEANGLLKVITDYANSWVTLQKYDERRLEIRRQGRVVSNLNYDLSKIEISKLKERLMSEGQATDIFGQDESGRLDGIIKNLEQTFAGNNLYPTIEERAAHLLYFVIKDHPFIDGNKRIGSFLFILFLVKNRYLYNQKGEKKINDNALVSLALLVAESDPKEKIVMTTLITNLLN